MLDLYKDNLVNPPVDDALVDHGRPALVEDMHLLPSRDLSCS